MHCTSCSGPDTCHLAPCPGSRAAGVVQFIIKSFPANKMLVLPRSGAGICLLHILQQIRRSPWGPHSFLRNSFVGGWRLRSMWETIHAGRLSLLLIGCATMSAQSFRFLRTVARLPSQSSLHDDSSVLGSGRREERRAEESR